MKLIRPILLVSLLVAVGCVVVVAAWIRSVKSQGRFHGPIRVRPMPGGD